MEIPAPKVGLVIAYSYVWRHEYRDGRREGVKDRPCVIVLAAVSDTTGATTVMVSPITHRPPQEAEAAVEIWPRTKERLGLDGERSWVVIDEINVFTWPGYDLRPVPKQPATCVYGPLPMGLMRQIQAAIAARHARIVGSDRDT